MGDKGRLLRLAFPAGQKQKMPVGRAPLFFILKKVLRDQVGVTSLPRTNPARENDNGRPGEGAPFFSLNRKPPTGFQEGGRMAVSGFSEQG